MNHVNFTVGTSKVAVVTIDMQGSKLNLLAHAVMAELSATLDQIAADKTIKGVIFASGKKGNFIAGANIEEIVQLQDSTADAYAAVENGKAIFAKIVNLHCPSIAAIDGTCLGGGTELALACTYRLASYEAKLGLPEVGLGILPGWGGIPRLTKLVGAEEAMAIITDPLKKFNAMKCWSIGMVDEIVKSNELMARAEAIVLGAKPKRAGKSLTLKMRRWFLDRTRYGRSMLAKGAAAKIKKATRGKQPAPPAVLKVVLASLTQPEKKAMELESRLFSQLAVTDVSKNLVGLYFARQESRKAPLNVKPFKKVGSIGVCGAGVMGAGIALVALQANYTVILYDKFPQGLEKGVAYIHSVLEDLVKKGKLSRDAQNNMLTSLAPTTELTGLKNCDLIIESIFEDMKLKQDLLAALEQVKGDTPFIFATNTSALDVTEMMSKGKNPENHGGLHFFNPPPKMPLIEVIPGAKTSPETIAALKEFSGRLLGKECVVSADKPGFIVNRILVPYAYEAIKLLELGVPPQDIEDAMLDFGMAMGPLSVLDEVGLDIAGKVVHLLHTALGDRLSPPKILNWIESQKLVGKKGGKGVFIWKDGKKAGFNPELIAALNVKPFKMDRGAIQQRLMLVMINEASRCIEENVVESASQLDLAMIYGCGFPPFRGGVLRYADSIGSATVVQNLTWLSKVAGDNYKPSALLLSKAANGGQRFYR